MLGIFRSLKKLTESKPPESGEDILRREYRWKYRKKAAVHSAGALLFTGVPGPRVPFWCDNGSDADLRRQVIDGAPRELVRQAGGGFGPAQPSTNPRAVPTYDPGEVRSRS